MNNQSLLELYSQHQGKVSDKWSIYLAEYQRLFAPYQDRPIRLLEIGVQNGGSLELWAKFFAAAEALVGCDIDPKCGELAFSDSRIAVIVGDANSDATEAEILSKCGRFDLIVDDGSHASGDIVRSFARYFKHLEDGGCFVVEDLHCSYRQEFQGGLFEPASSIAFFKRLADALNQEHWGIPEGRAYVLSSFMRKYGFDFDEQLLAHVHSVEFINSMCIVTKREPASNSIGPRFIAGQEERVVPGHHALHGTAIAAVDERGNPWSKRARVPEDEFASVADEVESLHAARQELELQLQLQRTQQQLATSLSNEAGLRRKIAELERQARTQATELQGYKSAAEAQLRTIAHQREQFLSSSSWKVTAPLRWSSRLLSKGLRKVDSVVANGGGLRRAEDKNNYQAWLSQYDFIDDELRQRMEARIAAMAAPPKISIVMPTYNAKPVWLAAAIESIRSQIYTQWELCIADDASTSEVSRETLQRYASLDPRIKVIFRKENGHIAAASNSAIELATGDWIALMDHDDLLPAHALFWIADCIERHPHAQLIYSDEDKIDEEGKRSAPYFKADWNIDLFYSHNMFSHIGAYRADLVKAVGGFRVGMEGSQDWDLVLRCIERIEPDQVLHIPRVLYHWRVHAESTASSAEAKPYAAIAGERAINEHLARRGLHGHVEYIGTGYRVHYALPAELPLVSLVIPTRNAHGLLKQCIDSILAKTSYANYEIIVIDNGSDDPESLAYLDSLRALPNVHVRRDDRPFNYSALNNAAVAEARGEVVALVNNDIEVISPEWLSEMVSLALQPGVGAVGAKLWYPDMTLQHGGVILGIGGVASHAHKGIPAGNNGYFGRAHLIQSFSAVTAACLVVRKDRYLAVGGLDEVSLTVAFNDVDFCLKLREAGYRNVWTPYAELIHHESATRGTDVAPEKQERFLREYAYMLGRWNNLLQADPAYSPNLTLDADDFSYAWPPRISRFPDSSASDGQPWQ